MRNILAGLLVALACAPAGAQVYKWVDANGVTHYSEKPPETGKAKEVPLREASPAGADAKTAPDASLQERERAFRQRLAERQQAEAKQAKDKAAREEDCKRARLHLADMNHSPMLYDLNDKGERVYMSDEQRAQTIAASQEDYNQHCN
jgi:hypothetical protein